MGDWTSQAGLRHFSASFPTRRVVLSRIPVLYFLNAAFSHEKF